MEKLKQNIILFDLDGTLTDSAEGVIRACQYMQEKLGQKVWATEDLKFIVGPPLMKTFKEDFGMDEELAEKALIAEGAGIIGLPLLTLDGAKAADGQQAKRIGRFLSLLVPDQRAHADRKLMHGDTTELGGDKMTEFMHSDQNAEHENGRDDIDTQSQILLTCGSGRLHGRAGLLPVYPGVRDDISH